MSQLAAPSQRYRDSFLGALAEFPADDNTLIFERQAAKADFDGYVRKCAAWVKGEQLPAGWVACSTFWLVDGSTYIGTVNIRHQLTEWLRQFGGHIGYTIRPSRRCEGHGTTICRLALPESKKVGLDRVLITCDEDNVGSRKIIEANGGVLEDGIAQPGTKVRKLRFWIELAGRCDPPVLSAAQAAIEPDEQRGAGNGQDHPAALSPEHSPADESSDQ